MWIEEIILDGFKSYQTRTTVSHLSPQFNAITGLNGSGKSNILDSICFVMGIRSLSQMRVNKMDELVYKQGQAGVTKASVTLVFNNENKASSPPQHRDKCRISITRQIVIGGRDRYLLNGHNAKPSDIQSLFLSVQLNVNNPHFLIMQGRITRVINMKPAELLGLVEEAAGTRMYEVKRTDSAKKIARKQSKLEEIQKVLEEEIQPALTTLRQERQDYNRWNSVSRQIEDLTRLCVAFSYYRDAKFTQDGKALLASEDRRREDLEARLDEAQRTVEDVERRINEHQQLRSSRQEPLDVLRNTLKEKEKERIKVRAAKDEASKTLSKLEKALKASEQSKASTEADIEKLRKDGDVSAQIARDALLQSVTEGKRSALSEAQVLLEALRTGQEAAGAGSLRGKLMETKTALTEATGEEASLKVSITKWQKEVKSLQSSHKVKNKELESLECEHRQCQATVQSLQIQLDDCNFSQDKLKELKEEYARVSSHLAATADAEHSKFTALSQALDIHRLYSHDKVKGPAFELFDVPEDHQPYRLALEECGKGKLFNVVVLDDKVAQHVLDNSRKRLTCIPLTQIRAPQVPTQKLQAAKKSLMIANDNHSDICLPLEIIRPKSETYTEALKFVFGSAILCSNSNIAKQISHDAAIRALAITRQGDTYNPQGTVSGGSKVGLGNLLESFAQYSKHREEAQQLNERQEAVKAELQVLGKTEAKHRALSGQLQAATVTLNGLQDRLAQLKTASGESHVDEILGQIENGNRRLEELRETIGDLKNRIPSLEEEIQDFTHNKAAKTTELQKKIETLKKEVKVAEKDLKTHRESIEGLREKSTLLSQQLADCKEAVDEACVKQQEERLNVDALLTSLSKHDAECQGIQQEIKEAESHLQETNEEVRALSAEKAKIEKSGVDAQAQLKKISHEQKNMKKSLYEKEKRKQQKESSYPWLRDELPNMNKAGSTFNFDGKNLDDMMQQLGKLETEKGELQRQINKKVLNMLEAAENQFEDLKGKRERVMQDKKSIESFMRDLDEKKNIALETCWKEVNSHFGGIFSSLLPHANARLCELDGQTFQEGLQMKVAFGGVWKTSLSELSGGQRSLLALSLVLALLKHKPAPLYILDEVDAALDLSHTQNIGHMIREHFQGSQFIIVSLKDNLFNYADVLFRTAFVSGNSTISRTQNRMSRTASASSDAVVQSRAGADKNDDKENKTAAAKRRRRVALRND